MKKLIAKRVSSYEELDENFPTHSIECLNWEDYPYKPDVSFQIGYDNDYIYIRYEVNESHIKGEYLNDGEPVWQESCVEFFVKQVESEHYFNIEANCLGTILASKRKSRTEDVVDLDAESLDSIIRGSSLPQKRINKENNLDSWALLLGIPFEVIGCAKPPKSLFANFYKCGDMTNTPHFLSWAPIKSDKPDFHLPQFFGEVIFE